MKNKILISTSSSQVITLVSPHFPPTPDTPHTYEQATNPQISDSAGIERRGNPKSKIRSPRTKEFEARRRAHAPNAPADDARRRRSSTAPMSRAPPDAAGDLFAANLKGSLLAVASSAFIGVSFIVKKKGLRRAGAAGPRAGPPALYFSWFSWFAAFGQRLSRSFGFLGVVMRSCGEECPKGAPFYGQSGALRQRCAVIIVCSW